MTKFVAFALIGATFAAPALSAPATTANEIVFSRDGQTYHATSADMGRYTRIRGHDDRGHQFEFRQTGTRVIGYYDDRYVDFNAAEVTRSAEVAAR